MNSAGWSSACVPEVVPKALLLVLIQGCGPAAELCTFRDQVSALFPIAHITGWLGGRG